MKKWSAHMPTGIETMTRVMRTLGTCRPDANGPACRRDVARGLMRVSRFAVVAVMAMVFGLAGFVASAEAAITYVNGTSQGDTTANATYNVSLVGLGIAQGDLVIVLTGFTGTADGNPGVTTAGYTEVFDLYSAGTRVANFSANYKIMGATPDTQVTVNGSGATANGSATVVHVWRGVDSTNPMDVPATTATGTGVNTPDSPSITPITAGAYVLSVGSGSRNTTAVTMTAPAGYTNAVSVAAQGGTLSFHVGAASRAWASGAENPAAWGTSSTFTSDAWAAGSLALRPLPACIDPDPSTITIPAGQTANGNPYVVSGMKTTTGDVGTFEYRTSKPGGAVTIPQNWTNPYNGTNNPGTVAYTVNAGSNRLLVVAMDRVTSANAQPTCDVTYRTQPMTKVANANDEASNTRQHSWLFYMDEAGLAAGSGANQFVFTCAGGTVQKSQVFAAVFAGVDQTSPIGAAQNYNSGAAGTMTPTFATALTVNSGEQAVGILMNTRTGSTTGRTNTAATNFNPFVQNVTQNTTVATRGSVANRTITTAGTEASIGTVSSATSTVVSMSAMSIKPGATICTNWTSNASIPATTAGGSLCGNYANGTYILNVRGTDPDCSTAVTTTPTNFTWNSCSETLTLTAPSVAGPITAPVTVTAGGTATGKQVSWSENAGSTWSAWVASGSTYTPTACTVGNVIFRAQGTGSCGTLTAQSAAVAFNTSDADLATLTVTGPASPVGGIKTVSVQVGTETVPAGLSAVVVNITNAGACNVSNGFMSWNGGTSRWEYSWDTTACGTGAVVPGVSIVASATDPDCSNLVTSTPVVVTIDNTCVDAVSTVSWTPPGGTVTSPIVVTAVVTGAATAPNVSFDNGASWLANGSTFTPQLDTKGTSQFMTRALDGCGKYIYGGPYAVVWDGQVARIKTISVAASAVGKTTIRVLFRYTSDNNNNAQVTLRYKLVTDSVWTTVGPYIDGQPGDNDGVLNKYVQFMLTALPTDSTYDLEVNVTDVDGVDATTEPMPWLGTVTLSSWVDSPLLHNALRFACSVIGYSDEAACTTAGGTWTLDRKWANGWGLPDAQYAGAEYDGFECSTCHAKNSTNIKRVITSVVAPSGTLPGSAVNLQTVVEGSADFGNDIDNHTTSNRVCEVCHSKTTYHRFDTTLQVNKQHNNNTDCVRCHEHNVGFRASCDSCHGTPPVTAGGLVTTDQNGPRTTGSTTPGEHQKHAVDLGFDCNTCHSGWDGASQMPNSANLNILFRPSVNSRFDGAVNPIDANNNYEGRPAPGGAYTAGAGTTLTQGTAAADMSCALYCHGYGRPVWNPTATVACGSCHGAVASGVGYRSGAPTGIGASKDLSGALTGFKVGKHANHLDDSVYQTGDPCALCHDGFSYTNITHVNGTVNIQLKQAVKLDAPGINGGAGVGSGFTPGTPGVTAGTCTNMSCHGDTPWDSASQLSCTQSCHNYPPVGTTAGLVIYPTIQPVSHVTANGTQYLKDNHGGCKYCHGWNDNGSGSLPISPMTVAEVNAMQGNPAVVPFFSQFPAGYHGDGSLAMNADGDANPLNDASYDPGSGGCDNAVCHGNDAAHQFNVGGGTTNIIQPADIGPGDCGACHTTGVGGATIVTPTSPHTKVTKAGSFTGCGSCHSGHYTKAGGVQIPNNPGVGINYIGAQHGGIKLGGPGTDASISGKTTEAEICWGCHDLAANAISEWGVNTKQTGSPVVTQYNYGTLTTSNWTTATWSSGKGASFSYKSGAIQSTHSVNSAGTSVVSGADYAKTEAKDSVANIRCSYCHDVHDAVGPNGKPYLRGTWWSNPYEEDGAPQSGQVFVNLAEYGAVPRGGQNVTNRAERLGGFWIDINNVQPGSASTTVDGTPYYNPTATGGTGAGGAWTFADSAGLCILCHTNDVNTMDQTTGEALWLGTNGHANAVIGGSGTASGNAANIFELRGGTANNNTQPAMHFKGGNEPGDSGSFGYRNGGNSQYNYTPSINTVSENTLPYNVELWGAALSYDNTTTNSLYHKFSCSKCHNPHASRLPKLMITNCLDTKHNTWDDTYQLNAQAGINQNRSISNWSSAQNCHRVGGIIPANRIIPGTGGTYPEAVDTGAVAAPTSATAGDHQNRGWNTVTPW